MKEDTKQIKVQNATMYLSITIVVLVLIIIFYNVIIKNNTEVIKNKLSVALKTLESFNVSEHM